MVLEAPPPIYTLVKRVRPDGLFYSSPTDVEYFDISVLNPSAASFALPASSMVLPAAQSRCSAKSSKFASWSLANGGKGFIPLACEVYGGVSQTVRKFFKFFTDRCVNTSAEKSKQSITYRSFMSRFSVM